MRRLLVPILVAAVVGSSAAAKPPPPPTQAIVVQTGRAPCGLAAHGGELWVGVYDAGVVLALDRAGRVRVGRFSCRIAVDEQAVWVTRDRADEIVRVDRRSGRLRRIAVDSPFDVALAAGAVWTTSSESGTVTRFDPASGRRTRTVRVEGYPTGIAACGGRLWVGHGRGATWLTSVDPRSGGTRRLDVVVESPGWPRCLRGELWVTTEDALLRVSPRTGRLRAHLPLGGTLAEVEAVQSAIEGFWSVWITDKERSLVHRIDPVSGRAVDSFPAGPGAFAIERFGGSAWITSFAGSDVRRFDP